MKPKSPPLGSCSLGSRRAFRIGYAKCITGAVGSQMTVCGRYKNPPFIVLLGLGSAGSKGCFPQQSQVSESNAREIRNLAGQRTLGFETHSAGGHLSPTLQKPEVWRSSVHIFHHRCTLNDKTLKARLLALW
jgi:hypothetical protein